MKTIYKSSTARQVLP